MQFPFSLLKSVIAFDQPLIASEVSNYLTSLGMEVEKVSNPALIYKNFIIAEVVECEKHKESEKLSICKVNTGNEILQVICGAQNVKKGLKVVFAKIGAIVPNGGLVIKKTTIRGVESSGMICSLEELNLEDSFFTPKDGIIELPLEAKVGLDFAEFAKLNDEIFEISITPNRGEVCSILGIARDLSAKKLGILNELFIESKTEFTKFESVKIEEPSYFGQINFAKFNNYKISQDVKNELEIYKKTWKSSLNDVVDFGNYIMFLTGAPVHIYDASKIKGNIFIRKSKEGELFMPIKGEKIALPLGLLVVSDEEKILSLIGVMGDERSKVTSETENFLLEVLHIKQENAIESVRKSGLKSDSSYRFERGVDFEIQKKVLELFLSKLEVKKAEGFFVDNHFAKKEILYKLEDYTERTGEVIEKIQLISILTSLGFIVKEEGLNFKIIVPSFRSDVTIKEDITEEIARILGYNTITAKPIKNLKPVKNFDLTFEIKKTLSENLNEVITYSFFKEEYFGLFSAKKIQKISLLNPITNELSTMRESLVPNLLTNVAYAEAKNIFSTQIFEVGTIFEGVKENEQKINIACLFSGFINEKSFLKEEEKFSIWHAKNKMCEVLFKHFGISESALKFEIFENKNLHTNQSFLVFLGKTLIGVLASLHPLTLDNFNIKQSTFFFELYMEALPVKKQKTRIYNQEALLDIKREIAIIIAKNVSFEKIYTSIKSLKISNLKEIEIKDVFENEERIGKDLKSILLQFTISQPNETLTKEQIDGEIIFSITEALSKLGAKLRDGKIAK